MTSASVSLLPFRAALQLLGTEVVVDSDRAELLDGVTSIYAAVPPLAGESTLHAQLRGLHPFAAELRIVDEGVSVGRARTWYEAGAATAFALFHAVARRAVGHLVLHAGAVQTATGVVLIVAPSRLGKTTVTVELALRGAAFLSDEAAPLSRRDGRVAPFPRAVGVRPGPLTTRPELARLMQRSPMVEERGGNAKALVDLSTVVDVGEAARVAHVVFLTTTTREQEPRTTAGWLLELDRVCAEFVSRLRAVVGVVAVDERGRADTPAVFVEAMVGVSLSIHIDRLCRETGCVLVRMVSSSDAAVDWNREPEVVELPATVGVLRAARNLLNGGGSSLVERELGGSAAAVVIELATALNGARFWAMSPGRLATMCTLVEQLS